jgi:hypothetical protein
MRQPVETPHGVLAGGGNPMGFTAAYLEQCWHKRRIWSRKRTQPGDWYLAVNPPQLHVASDADQSGVDFSAEDIAFVPDADDLLELLDNQVTAHGVDSAQKSLTISYTPNDQWHIEIACGEMTTVAGGHESLHAALTVAYFQLAGAPRWLARLRHPAPVSAARAWCTRTRESPETARRQRTVL